MISVNSKEFEAIRSAVLKCGAEMRDVRNVEGNASNIKAKPGDANFVTVFDVGIQNELISALGAIMPSAQFFAEEKENTSLSEQGEYCFVIDPIDGTTNFIHDMGASAISVGLLNYGEPVMGIILDPYRDELFYAVKGEGAYLNGKKISVSDRTFDRALVAFGTSPYDREKLGRVSFENAYRVFTAAADIRRSGSAAIDLACVACGRLDAFFEGKLSPWDYCAGYVIVTEAGGSVTRFDASPIGFDKPSSMLCTNGRLTKEFAAILK